MATKSKTEEGAIGGLMYTLRNTLSKTTSEKAEQEYMRLKGCLRQLQTKYAKQYASMTSSEPSKKEDDTEQMTKSQRDNARGILQVIKTAEQMENIDRLIIKRAKTELFSLINAHYFLQMINPDCKEVSTAKNPLAELLDSGRIRGVDSNIHDQAVNEYKSLLSCAESPSNPVDASMFEFDPRCSMSDIEPKSREAAEQLHTVLNMAQVDEYIRNRAIKEFIYLTDKFLKVFGFPTIPYHARETESDKTFIDRKDADLEELDVNQEGSERKRGSELSEETVFHEQPNLAEESIDHGSSYSKLKRKDSWGSEEAKWSPKNLSWSEERRNFSTKGPPIRSSSSPTHTRRHYFRSHSTSSAEGEDRVPSMEPMRSLRESLVLDQERSPLKELATSYRQSGRVSEDLSQGVLEEVTDLYGKHKNFKLKFPRQARLSESFSQDIEDIPDIPDSSFKNVMRFLRSVDRDDELYRDAVQECAQLVESEKKYYLAKSTNVSFMIPQPDRHGNVVLTRKEYDELQAELTKKTQEVDELSSRLSRMASQQMTEGNPNIADLSDRFRPTKIGEMFGQLYDDEWAEAFEALKEKSEVTEDDDEFQVDILKKLVHIVQKAFEFSSKETERQLHSIKDGLLRSSRLDDSAASSTSPQDSDQEVESFCLRTAKDVRKKLASHSWKKAAEKFQRESMEALIFKHGGDQRLKDYANKCTELTWYMSVQDPSMVLLSPGAGDKLNTAEFCYHGRKGKKVELCVWPALFLHEGGPLVSKGHILPME